MKWIERNIMIQMIRIKSFRATRRKKKRIKGLMKKGWHSPGLEEILRLVGGDKPKDKLSLEVIVRL